MQFVVLSGIYLFIVLSCVGEGHPEGRPGRLPGGALRTHRAASHRQRIPGTGPGAPDANN
eukprot:scaffold220081_cov39-Prasinocladus_malaysianus.AAC.2